MDRKRILSIFIGLFMFIIPFGVEAQTVTVEELLAQIQSLLIIVQSLQEQIAQITGDSTCTVSSSTSTSTIITTNLTLGVSDTATNNNVSKLQRFLRATGDFTYPSITGYFGPATRNAVRKYQLRNKIVTSPFAPGYGLAGPITRAHIRLNGEITFPPTPPTPSACSFNGTNITSGNSVTAYQSSTVPAGSNCAKQTRTCTNGFLSGNYSFSSCSVEPPVVTPKASCTLDGVTVKSGSSRKFFRATNMVRPSTCSSVEQTRTCRYR